jgi:hypothetical protein
MSKIDLEISNQLNSIHKEIASINNTTSINEIENIKYNIIYTLNVCIKLKSNPNEIYCPDHGFINKYCNNNICSSKMK